MDNERREQILDNWNNEIESPGTMDWRDDLTPEELDYVAQLDKGWRRGFPRMAAALVIMDKIRARYGPKEILELKAAGDRWILRLRDGSRFLARLDCDQELRLDAVEEVC